MSWKKQRINYPNTTQELEVGDFLSELSEGTYATTSEELIRKFKSELDHPRYLSNRFPGNLLFKMTPRNKKSVEVWKTTLEGEFKKKMWQLDYVENK